MQAMVAKEYGSADVFEMREVEDPRPGPLDVLIEVHATALNPVDTKIRQGYIAAATPPMVLGYDVSGVVVAVGEKVERFAEGDEVYASPALVRQGANAELVAVDSRTIAYKPGNVSHGEAAAIPLTTITAWEALHQHARLHTGETILIHAGAGGVGHVAIQLAKLHGSRVITTASRSESIDFCRMLGADAVINYEKENVVEHVMELTEGKGCPVVFDTVGGDVFMQSMDCLAVHGRLVTIVQPKEDASITKLFRKDASIHLEFMGAPTMHGTRPSSQGGILKTVSELVEADRLKPHIHKTYKLADLAEAHRQQETRHTTGKLVVEVK